MSIDNATPTEWDVACSAINRTPEPTVNKYIKLAKTLEAYAFLLDPQKIAGHRNQVTIMREAAAAILELDRQLREMHEELAEVKR